MIFAPCTETHQAKCLRSVRGLQLQKDGLELLGAMKPKGPGSEVAAAEKDSNILEQE